MSNVIFVDARLKKNASPPLLAYFHQTPHRLGVLKQSDDFEVMEVNSAETLERLLSSNRVFLTVMESDLTWRDPVALIQQLQAHDTPVVVFCDGTPRSKSNAKFLKKAYAAGLHDALFAPFDTDEITQVLTLAAKSLVGAY